ncbi:transcriptional regulatory protein [Cutibacterium acnes JCM 18918]|nr:transcriptional regulatory protein [Cutibacterium acnes JCM 18918]
MPAAVERPHRDEVRSRILAAAAHNFERDGYVGASLRRIATDAGFTKGAVYSNFGSKPDLFGQVCAARLTNGERDLVDALSPILSSCERPDDLMRNISEKLTEILLEDAPWQVILAEFRALARRDAEIAKAYSKLQSQRIAQLAELMTQYGVLDHIESADAATHAVSRWLSSVWSMCLPWSFLWQVQLLTARSLPMSSNVQSGGFFSDAFLETSFGRRPGRRGRLGSGALRPRPECSRA